MNLKEFNTTVIRHEYPEFVELDLRRFGAERRNYCKSMPVGF
jgi:hypothetical protein